MKPANSMLLTSRGYVEKTAAQIREAQGDEKGANEFTNAAARYFRAALKLDPTDVGALNGQANIHLIHHQYRRAATIGRVVVSLRPDYTAAHWDLAIALMQLVAEKPGRALVEELADVYEKLVQLIPNEPSGFTPADLARVQQDTKRYRQLADRLAAKRSPQHSSRP